MSFREIRNFCEILRSLGYPRIVSMENFKRPNFQLVADIALWIALKFDPNSDISDNIEDQGARVEFIKSICQLFANKARVKLNPKKLYQSDGYAVQELLKVCSLLYSAGNTGNLAESENEFQLPSRLSNLKDLKKMATDLVDGGTKLYDLIGREEELKQAREKALTFLDNVARNSDTSNEQMYIQRCVMEIIQQQTENIDELQDYVQKLEKEEKILEDKIKRKNMELEKAQKRISNLSNVKPGFIEEVERLERDLERLYQVYLEKMRNLDYFEHQIDLFNLADQKKLEEAQKGLTKLQKKIKDEEEKWHQNDVADIDEEDENEENEAPPNGKSKNINKKPVMTGSLNPDDEEEEEENPEDIEENERKLKAKFVDSDNDFQEKN